MRFATLAPPDVGIAAVQTSRKVYLLLTVALVCVVFVVSTSRWDHPARATIEWIGLALLVVCIVGRTWCALYIGGRKTRELVTVGPYSLARNPLYLFSVIGGVGVGAQLGAVSVAALAGLFAWIVHVPVMRREECRLLAAHGDRYREYVARVPRFLPRLSGWQDVERLEVRPHAVVRTFLDACCFLAAVPVVALIGYLHNAGAIRVLLHLP
jgi:protein-S-isoprenylcysteine O-methyltransferase Ste14